eukprot:Transcript_7302.p3 GENE.Transcript_7302~~Transcript_7302.p3  ORF type:complete len:149 (+),score=1.97 Transcript_7302:654-1100(+)
MPRASHLGLEGAVERRQVLRRVRFRQRNWCQPAASARGACLTQDARPADGAAAAPPLAVGYWAARRRRLDEPVPLRWAAAPLANIEVIGRITRGSRLLGAPAENAEGLAEQRTARHPSGHGKGPRDRRKVAEEEGRQRYASCALAKGG